LIDAAILPRYNQATNNEDKTDKVGTHKKNSVSTYRGYNPICYITILWKFLTQSTNHTIAAATVVSVVIALSYAVISLLQYRISRNSLIESERAFISISPGTPVTFIKAGVREWQIPLVLGNGGTTPTKNLTIRFGEVFQHNFDYVSKKNVLVHHMTPQNGLTPLAFFRTISPTHFFEGGKQQYTFMSPAISNTRAFGSDKDGSQTFIWGLAEYDDVFNGTQKHLTEFCLLLTQSAGSGVPQYGQCDQNNCADDECLTQDAAQARNWHPFRKRR
jgi:hypothetical protein